MNELLEFLMANPGVDVNLVYNNGDGTPFDDGLTITIKPDPREPHTWKECTIDTYTMQQAGFRDAFISDKLQELAAKL